MFYLLTGALHSVERSSYFPSILWSVNAHKHIATHCCPAFCPNTTTFHYIWRFYCATGIHIVHTSKMGFYLYHYKACSLYSFLCDLHPFTHYMANYTIKKSTKYLRYAFLRSNLTLVLCVLFFCIVFFLINR